MHKREQFCSVVREHVKKYGLIATLRKHTPVEEEEEIIIDDKDITQVEQEITRLQSEKEQVERDLISSDDRQKDLTEENKQLLTEPTGGEEFIRLQAKMKIQQDKCEQLDSKCRDLERSIMTMGSMDYVDKKSDSSTTSNNETFICGGVNWHNSTSTSTGNMTSKKRVSFYCYEENVSNMAHSQSENENVCTGIKYENVSDYPSRGQEPQRDLKELYPVNEPNSMPAYKGNVNYYGNTNNKQEQLIVPVNIQQREQHSDTSVQKEGQCSYASPSNYHEQQQYSPYHCQENSKNSQTAYWKKRPQPSAKGQKKGFVPARSLGREQYSPVEILTEEEEQDSPVHTWDGERQVGQTLQFVSPKKFVPSPKKFVPKKPSSIGTKFKSRHH